MIDTYATFEDLAMHTVEGQDYRIVTKKTNSPFLSIAIHGGSIEPLTSEIASSIAGDEHNLYLFEGLRTQRNEELHIGSEYFDEPRMKDMERDAEVIISIHGYHSVGGEFVMVGGLCTELVEKIITHLQEVDIEIRQMDALLHTESSQNICNKGMSGGGVDIEISEKLRVALQEDAGLYRLFTNAIRHAIEAYHIT